MNNNSAFISKIFILLLAIFFVSACTTSQTNSSKLESKSILTKLATPSAQPKTTAMEEFKELSDFKPNPATEATLVTTKGEITIELFRDEAPLTTANFVDLASSGFYDQVVFHRVIEDFMAQVGDPLSKDENAKSRWGTGGPGYRIKDEFSPSLVHDKPGMVSMANAGPNSGGSQFFITHVATPWLDGKHAVFGQVTQGMDVLMSIAQGDKILSIKLK